MENQQNNAQSQDIRWMRRALQLAEQAAKLDEVPVGAILVHNSKLGEKLVAKAFNRRESWKTPLGHAELIAIQRASQKLGAWRLSDCTLYVTLEPCVMCAGALVQSRISRLVFGAKDSKGGGSVSLYQIPQDTRLNHRLEVTGGVLEEECALLLSDFFRAKRKKKPRV